MAFRELNMEVEGRSYSNVPPPEACSDADSDFISPVRVAEVNFFAQAVAQAMETAVTGATLPLSAPLPPKGSSFFISVAVTVEAWGPTTRATTKMRTQGAFSNSSFSIDMPDDTPTDKK